MKRIIIAILLSALLLTAFAACGGSPAAETEMSTFAEPVTILPDVGEGGNLILLLVVGPNGEREFLNVRSDEKTLGKALQAAGVVEGEVSQYGLYITRVRGVEASYETDQAYWALYVDGEYAAKGVDDYDLSSPHIYELRYSKG